MTVTRVRFVAVLCVALLLHGRVTAQSCACNTSVVWSALKDLFDSTDGAHWTNCSRWLEPDSTVCEWYGFSNCGVGEWLLLANNNLRGTLPASMSNIATLAVFDVANNALRGTLPPEFSAWAGVRVFRVANNSITGTLPPQYSAWVLLEDFRPQNNSISGSLPPEYSTWLLLKHFTVFRNRISGTLPPQYQEWVATEYFDVNSNELTGTLPPAYRSWSLMRDFEVYGNSLAGTLPPEYQAWTQLKYFHVGVNRIVGSLPPEYSAWQALTAFWVFNNQLSGTLPLQYSSWTSMLDFEVYNNTLTGTIPAEYAAFVAISTFLTFNNLLSGTLPPQLSSWTRLANFVVANNSLTGSLPPEYSVWPVSAFFVASNRLSGTIPSQYSAWPSLAIVALSNNFFTGRIPATWTGKFFAMLYLHNNLGLSGTLPAGLSIPFYVSLCNTSICGAIPASWTASKWICQNASVYDIGLATHGDLSVLKEVAPYLPACPTPAPTTRIPLTPAPVINNNSEMPRAVPLSPALAASSGLMTTALGANAIAAVALTAVAGGGASSAAPVGSFVQVSSLSARVSVRLRDCGAPSSSPSDTDSAVNDEVGSLVGDNPTRLMLPGRLSSSGGTVVGNVLLLFVAPPVAAGVYHTVRKAVATARGSGNNGAQILLSLAVRLHLVVYSWLLAPTAAAAALLLADGGGGGGGGPAALGVFGLVVAAAPTAVITVAYVRSRPLKGKVFSAQEGRRRSSWSFGALARRLCADRGSWNLPHKGTATSRGRPKAALGVVSQLLQHAMSEALHGSVFPHGYVFLVDAVIAAAQGLLAGSALSPAAAPSCAAVRRLLWSIFAVNVSAAAFEAWVRPRGTLLDEGITLVMALWTAVVSLLSALDLEDAASDAAAAQAALSLCCVVLQLVSGYVRRLSKIREKGEASVTYANSARLPPAAAVARSPRKNSARFARLLNDAGSLRRMNVLKVLVEEICAARRVRSGDVDQ